MFSVLGRLLQFLSRIQQGRPETFGRNMLVSAIRRCGVTASQDIKRPKAYFQATRPCCTVLYYTRPKSMEHPPAFGKLVRKTPQMTNRLAVEERCNWGRLRDSISRADPVSQDAVYAAPISRLAGVGTVAHKGSSSNGGNSVDPRPLNIGPSSQSYNPAISLR